MGHMMEDFDSIGSAIGVAKMALITAEGNLYRCQRRN